MQSARKMIGSLVLAAFVLVAGSVICLASGQPGVMSDCGNQMSGAAMCPFMSASIPAVAAASLGETAAVLLVLALVFVAVAAVREDSSREAIALSRYRHGPDLPPVSFLNSTLKLISQGVLHSRVFSF
jgi:hypothetical protein